MPTSKPRPNLQGRPCPTSETAARLGLERKVIRRVHSEDAGAALRRARATLPWGHRCTSDLPWLAGEYWVLLLRRGP